MKAIRVHNFGPPEVMQLEEVPDLVPGAGQVLVTVKAVGVNPVDTYFRSGLYRPDMKLPYTPGLDAAGVITAVGPEVQQRTVGQRVYVARSLSGTYAEQVLCKEASDPAIAGGDHLRLKERPSACPMARHTAPSSSGPARRRERRCWCMAPAAGSGLRRCSWPGRPGCG